MRIYQELQILFKQRTIAGITAQELINAEAANLASAQINPVRIHRSYSIACGIYRQALPEVTKRERYYLKKMLYEGFLKWQS